jgi:hypothetical protein
MNINEKAYKDVIPRRLTENEYKSSMKQNDINISIQGGYPKKENSRKWRKANKGT